MQKKEHDPRLYEVTYSQEVYEEEQSHKQTGLVSKETSWEPEVALVTMNVQDHVNESVPSLDAFLCDGCKERGMNERR